MNDEVGVVGLDPALLDLAGVHRDGEQPFGRLVHQRGRAGRVGDDNRVGHRVDNQIQSIALRARLHLGHPQLTVILFDFLAGAAQIADIPQNGDDAGPVARIFGDGAQQLEQQVRSIDRVDQQQLASGGACLLDCLARQGR